MPLEPETDPEVDDDPLEDMLNEEETKVATEEEKKQDQVEEVKQQTTGLDLIAISQLNDHPDHKNADLYVTYKKQLIEESKKSEEIIKR